MEELYGRQKGMLKDELSQLDDSFQCRKALLITNKVSCQRCGSHFSKNENQLSSKEYYCPYCIQFGRLSTQTYLVTQNETKKTPREVCFTWRGKLTPAQQKGVRQYFKELSKG